MEEIIIDFIHDQMKFADELLEESNEEETDAYMMAQYAVYILLVLAERLGIDVQ